LLYYLHIPKSAGTSLRSLCKCIYGSNLIEVYRRIDPDYVRSLGSICNKDSVLFGHFCFSLHLLLGDSNPRYMTVLRDPVERVVSWYKSVVRDPTAEQFDRIYRDRLSLAEAVELGIAAEVNNHAVRVLSGNYKNWKLKYHLLNRVARLHGKEQYQFDGKRYLDSAVANLNNFFCYVGITERLDRFADFISRQSGMASGSLLVPREDVAPPMDLKLDSQTLSVIQRANELDLILYKHVALKLRNQEAWYPVDVGPRTLLSRLQVSRLAIPRSRVSPVVLGDMGPAQNHYGFLCAPAQTDLDHARNVARMFLTQFENYVMDQRRDCILVQHKDLDSSQEHGLPLRLDRYLQSQLPWAKLRDSEDGRTVAHLNRWMNRWRREGFSAEVHRLFQKYLRTEIAHLGFPVANAPEGDPVPFLQFRLGALSPASLQCSGDGQLTLKDDHAEITVTGSDFWVILPLPVFDAVDVHEIWVSVKGVIGNICSLYWRGQNEDFSEERCLHVPYKPGPYWQVIRFGTFTHPLWTGSIAALRLDLFNSHTSDVAGTGLLRSLRAVE
jgi:sulfotransferase famil protein